MCTLAKPPPKAVVIPERLCHHCNLVAWQPAGSNLVTKLRLRMSQKA